MDTVIPQAAAPRAAGSSPALPTAHRAGAQSFDRVLSSSVDDEQPRVGTERVADGHDATGPADTVAATAARNGRAAGQRRGGAPKGGVPSAAGQSGASTAPSTAAASGRAGRSVTASDADEQEASAAPDAPDEGAVVVTTTGDATGSVDALASGGLPAALFISLTAPVAAGATTQQEEASGDEQAGEVGQASSAGSSTAGTQFNAGAVALGPAAMPKPDVTSAAAAPPAPASAETDAGTAAARAVSEDLEAALSAAASHEQGSEGAGTQAAEQRAANAATPHVDHPARRLAHEILAQVVSPAGRESGRSDGVPRQTPANAGPTPGALAVALPETTVSAEAARPGRLAIGARVRADAGSEQATSPVAPFLDTTGDAGQDQRGGASRGGHAWSFTWATAAEMPRTAVKTGGGQPAGGPFSMMAAPAEPVAGAGPTSAVTAGETAAAATPTPLADADMARQVVRAVSLAWHDQVGEARLHLTPEHLGEVTVSLRVERGVVSAVLQADTAAARDWIRLHENDLRQGLEGQGLHLDSMVVTEDGTSQGRQDQQAPPRQPRRPPTSPDAPRFEVRV